MDLQDQIADGGQVGDVSGMIRLAIHAVAVGFATGDSDLSTARLKIKMADNGETDKVTTSDH